ncbi:MAG: hypothetical protein WC900_01630, partial [Oscillospiraceae bacterium]
MFKQKNNKLIYFYDNETTIIEPWGENALRVRSTMNPEFTEHDWALLPSADTVPEIKISVDGGANESPLANMYAGSNTS